VPDFLPAHSGPRKSKHTLTSKSGMLQKGATANTFALAGRAFLYADRGVPSAAFHLQRNTPQVGESLVSPGGHTLLREIYAFASGDSMTVPEAIPRFGEFCIPGRAQENNHGGQLHPY